MSAKPKAYYKKPKNKAKAVFATVRIVGTFAVIAVLGMIFFYAVKDGWDAVFAWFGGKYACMCVIILLVAITLAAWLYVLINRIRRLKEDE